MRKSFLLILPAAALVLSACATAADKPAPHSRAEAKARKYPPLPEGVERRHVTIWSDGTRMAADIYSPKSAKPGEKLPVIVFANGTGGMKRKLPTRMAPHFTAAGYIFVAFDYRGWGESDSRLMMLNEMPDPDADETVTVKARAIRWQLDRVDQCVDIRNVMSYMAGEKNADANRIGLLGTSYGGGLVTWVAAHDKRVKCLIGQVPGMGGGRIAQTEHVSHAMATKQTRGETEPVPYKTNRPGGKMSAYGHMRHNRSRWIGHDPVADAHKITVPTLFIDGGKDELMSLERNAGAVTKILQKKGTIVKYHIIKDMTHYGVYRQNFKQVIDIEIAWFDKYLKTAK